jgi:hypothetical protein
MSLRNQIRNGRRWDGLWVLVKFEASEHSHHKSPEPSSSCWRPSSTVFHWEMQVSMNCLISLLQKKINFTALEIEYLNLMQIKECVIHCYKMSGKSLNSSLIISLSIVIVQKTFVFKTWVRNSDRFCGLVVRVPGYRSRGPEFNSQHYQIFWEVVGQERSPLSLVSTVEELLGRKRP